jgi:hypothetical protein
MVENTRGQLSNSFSQFIAEIRSEDDVLKVVRPHLMSREIEWEYDGHKNLGIVLAGWRQVGTFTRIDDLE